MLASLLPVSEARNALNQAKMITALANACRTQGASADAGNGFDFCFLGIVFSPAVLGLDSDRSDSVWAGVNQCIVLAVMANRPREDSEVDPLEDEMDFCKSMRQAGFKKQFPFQMPLSVPGEECLERIRMLLKFF